jgi:transcription elongation factor Elf1
MGKRKSKARVMKKVVALVATVFDCPFCNHQKTVECKM